MSNIGSGWGVCAAAVGLLAATVAWTGAWAKVSPEEAARLGKDLTPMGAEKAGNADGTIPAWDGGITQPPSSYQPGRHYPDPFADDQPLFTITAANHEQYKDRLTTGQIAMFKRYPDSWTMAVYPSRRSASYPPHVYEATVANAGTAELTAEGWGVRSASVGVPFPIPKNGLECIWNHLMRYRGEEVDRLVGQVAPTPGGAYSLVMLDEKVIWAYQTRGATIESIRNRLAYFLQTVTEPPRLAGRILLVHETLDQIKEPRTAYVYNPGQRRVRRAPNVAYDNPGTASDGQRTNDQSDMFNGAPDRYEWTLVGKTEKYIPYNCYRLHGSELKYADIIRPGHIRSDVIRYELHRVWEVVATLREGTSHIYAKRHFYLDEDSWQVVAVDQYDKRGELWRVSEAYTINYYDQPLLWDTLQCHYDLQNGRYLAFGLANEGRVTRFDTDLTPTDFMPEALRRMGRR